MYGPLFVRGRTKNAAESLEKTTLRPVAVGGCVVLDLFSLNPPCENVTLSGRGWTAPGVPSVDFWLWNASGYVRAASAQSAVGTPVHRSASSSPLVVCCQALFDLLVLDVCLVTGASKEAGLVKVL